MLNGLPAGAACGAGDAAGAGAAGAFRLPFVPLPRAALFGFAGGLADAVPDAGSPASVACWCFAAASSAAMRRRSSPNGVDDSAAAFCNCLSSSACFSA